MNPAAFAPGEELPPGDALMSERLSRLSALDRAATPPGLSARVYRASLPALQHRPEEPATYAFPRARAGGMRRALAMAAGLALLATVSATWLAGQRTSTTVVADKTTVTDPGLETWLAIAIASESTQADSIDKIAADADELTRALSGDWMPDDLFYSDQPSAEESM